jgi:hypothetical protein
MCMGPYTSPPVAATVGGNPATTTTTATEISAGEISAHSRKLWLRPQGTSTSDPLRTLRTADGAAANRIGLPRRPAVLRALGGTRFRGRSLTTQIVGHPPRPPVAALGFQTRSLSLISAAMPAGHVALSSQRRVVAVTTLTYRCHATNNSDADQ